MSPEEVPRFRAEILRLREKYAGRLEIYLGLEQDYYSPPSGEGWDYLIGSVHCVEKEGRLLPVDYLPEDLARSVRQYYGGDWYALAEDYFALAGGVAERTGCQIVGHFDLIAKFNEGDRLFDTGAMARGYRSAPYPAPWLLRAMAERKLPICITSDCHERSNLLFAFPQAAELARSCGYRESMVLTRAGFVPEPL